MLTKLIYKTILRNCERTLQSGDQTLVPIANAMYEKLLQYEGAIASNLARQEKFLDPRLPSDIIDDSSILRTFVTCPENDPSICSRTPALRQNGRDFEASLLPLEEEGPLKSGMSDKSQSLFKRNQWQV